MYKIADFYDEGRGGLKKDEKEALKYYQKAAEKGNRSAMEMLCIFYDYGKGGLKKNARTAFKWYKESKNPSRKNSNTNDLNSDEIDLDDLLADVVMPSGTNEESANNKVLVKNNSNDGVNQDAALMYELGVNYTKDYGWEKHDIKKAIEWFKRAADKGCIEAKNAMEDLCSKTKKEADI